MRFASALLVLAATLAAHQIDTASAATVRGGDRRTNANANKMSRRELKKGGDNKGAKSGVDPNNYAFGTTAITGPATPALIAEAVAMAGSQGANVVADEQESSTSKEEEVQNLAEDGQVQDTVVDISNYVEEQNQGTVINPTAQPPTYLQSRQTPDPTLKPSPAPVSATPTPAPVTPEPTDSPSASPTSSPTMTPSAKPSTASPTPSPSSNPTMSPTTSEPTDSPSASPTSSPTMSPTKLASDMPSAKPTTASPTPGPTPLPTRFPTSSPTMTCAGVMEKSQACGSENGNKPQICCEGLVCEEDGPHCVEPTIEDVIAGIVAEMTPTTAPPSASPTASPSAAPVTPTPLPTEEPTGSPTAAPFVSGRMDICAGKNERAVTCGAENSDRPHLCCPGFVCSNSSRDKKYACVPAPPTLRPTLSPTTAAPVAATSSPVASPTLAPVVPAIENNADAIAEVGGVDPVEVADAEPATTEETTNPEEPAGCGIEIDTKCFVHEPYQVVAVDCQDVTGTAHKAGELLDVTWSYTLTNTCADDWTVIARQNLQSCELCLGSGLQCEKEVNFFQPTEDNCVVLDSSGRYLGFPPGCAITENVFNEIKVGSDKDGRCIYNKEVNLRVIDGETTKPVALKYSFVSPMPFPHMP